MVTIQLTYWQLILLIILYPLGGLVAAFARGFIKGWIQYFRDR